jgi:ABC-type phosphate transport system substrate-binding protein
MRSFIKLMAGVAIAATATAMAIGPAMADPIGSNGKPVTPKETDITGVGSDTIEFLLDQLSVDYNASHKTGPRLYSWDATNPVTGATLDPITDKSGCTKEPRPDGSSAGILSASGGPLALTSNLKTKDGKEFCTDFARSSRGRNPATDPAKGKGGVVFVTLAKDAVTYATNKTTFAPANLTTAQLHAIYTCSVTTWGQVGGTKGKPINPQLPQTSSGTRSFFLGEIGVASPGNCVNDSKGEPATAENPTGNFPEENEGTNKYLQGPNVIYPYSIGKYLAQAFHSAKCLEKGCVANGKGLVCAPTKTQNRFGCDVHGSMVLRNINKTKPTVGTGAKQTINPNFSHDFIRLVYVVVRWANTKDNIPAYLEPLFASSHAKTKGWICSSPTATKDMISYGFLPTPFCGTGS